MPMRIVLAALLSSPVHAQEEVGVANSNITPPTNDDPSAWGAYWEVSPGSFTCLGPSFPKYGGSAPALFSRYRYEYADPKHIFCRTEGGYGYFHMNIPLGVITEATLAEFRGWGRNIRFYEESYEWEAARIKEASDMTLLRKDNHHRLKVGLFAASPAFFGVVLCAFWNFRRSSRLRAFYSVLWSIVELGVVGPVISAIIVASTGSFGYIVAAIPTGILMFMLGFDYLEGSEWALAPLLTLNGVVAFVPRIFGWCPEAVGLNSESGK